MNPEKLTTTIELEEPLSKVREVFPSTLAIEVLSVFYKDKLIWQEDWPMEGTKELARQIGILSEDFSSALSKRTIESSFICIEGEKLQTLLGDKGTRLKLTTYCREEGEHYDRLEKVKIVLLQRGFTIKNAKCQMTALIQC